jgi:hypothetical protein
MKRLILAICMFAASLGASAQQADPALTGAVGKFMDGWYDDAAHSRQAHFDKLAADAVVVGTDEHERWSKGEFKAAVKKRFESKSAFNFKPLQRHVYASKDGSLVWLDEVIDTREFGLCKSSAVLRKTSTGFEIVHYELAYVVPNKVAGQVEKLVKDAQSNPQASK